MECAEEKPPEKFRFTEGEKRVYRPREKISVSEWAEKYRVITRGPAGGKWRNSFTPYATEPMDTIGLPWVRKIILCWAPQTGKTSVALNHLLYTIDVDPGPAFYILPDEKLSKRVCKRTIIPTIRQTPRVAALLSPRAEDVSRLHVGFTNGADLMVGWASSASQLASESIRYLYCDELGKWPEFSGKEADPLSLAEVRATVYGLSSKEIYFSTPNVSGDSFDKLMQNDPDETRRYHARCPFCGQMQLMDLSRIHWQGKKDHREVLRLKLGRYACEKCGFDWDDFARNRAVLDGEWRAENPVDRPGCVLFGPLESWYSPMVSLSRPAAAFLKSKEDRSKLMAFTTQHQAQPWREAVSTKGEADILRHKITLPPGIAPEWAVALTAGIDVQQRGFWFVVRAWGPDLSSHLVLYGHLSSFDEVESLVFDTTFPIEGSGESLAIWRAAIDTGGFKGLNDDELTRTEEIYEFCRAKGKGVIFACKGASRPQFARVMPPRPLDVMPHSKKLIRGGLELRLIDVNEFKKTFHWRLTRRASHTDEAGRQIPGESQRITLHAETGIDYAQQILAEELRRTRGGKVEWVQIRRDNHLLDCENLAAACADNGWQPCLQLMARHSAARLKAQSKPAQASNQEPPKENPADFIQQRMAARRRRRPTGGWMDMG